jgi:hypothetical protein
MAKPRKKGISDINVSSIAKATYVRQIRNLFLLKISINIENGSLEYFQMALLKV